VSGGHTLARPHRGVHMGWTLPSSMARCTVITAKQAPFGQMICPCPFWSAFAPECGHVIGWKEQLPLEKHLPLNRGANARHKTNKLNVERYL
jgi:hypothetical protein